MARFETETLSTTENLKHLMDLSGQWIDQTYQQFLFNQFGDLERVLLRRGNRASAKYWRRVLLPVIDRLWSRSRGPTERPSGKDRLMHRAQAAMGRLPATFFRGKSLQPFCRAGKLNRRKRS